MNSQRVADRLPVLSYALLSHSLNFLATFFFFKVEVMVLNGTCIAVPKCAPVSKQGFVKDSESPIALRPAESEV